MRTDKKCYIVRSGECPIWYYDCSVHGFRWWEWCESPNPVFPMDCKKAILREKIENAKTLLEQEGYMVSER